MASPFPLPEYFGSATPSKDDFILNLPDPYPVVSGRVARGRLTPPASKSVSQRLLNLAFVFDADLELTNLLFSDDIEHFLGGMSASGLEVERTETGARIGPGPRPDEGDVRLDCGAGGTMFRFVVAAAATRRGSFLVDGTPRLRERPIGPLVDALRQLGVRIDYLGEEGRCPLRVHGGMLEGGFCVLDAGLSSQYLSSLIMASLRAKGRVEIELTALVSTPYVDLTLESIETLGLSGVEKTPNGYVIEPFDGALPASGSVVQVEADDSAVAYPAAAALLTGGRVTLDGLHRESSQGDRQLLAVLDQIGAELQWSEHSLTIGRRQETLNCFDVDMSEIPDQVPTLAAIAPFCDGVSRIRNVPHLRIKESDRLAAMAEGLTRCGFSVEELPDGLVIQGSAETPSLPEVVDVATYDDHRIAMSMALVGLRRPGVRIHEPDVVFKSYPSFWTHLESLFEP